MVQQATFDFSLKSRLQSKVDVIKRRSQKVHKTPEKPEEFDPWKIKPLDLKPRTFGPKPPRRGARTAVQRAKTDASEEKRGKSVKSAKSSKEARRERAILSLERMTARGAAEEEVKSEWEEKMHKSMGAHEARVLFVKEGKFKQGKYRNPKPFDHRYYEPRGTFELPDFQFPKSHKENSFDKIINTIHGPSLNLDRNLISNQKDHYKKVSHLQFDPNLILPPLPYPNKYAAYSRHRRTDRSARSAYLERAADMLNRRRQNA